MKKNEEEGRNIILISMAEGEEKRKH